jgi:hypothetical protein
MLRGSWTVWCKKVLYLKKANGSDKRAVDILISTKGLELLNQMDKEVSISGIVSSNLTPDEAGQLNILLDKMRG